VALDMDGTLVGDSLTVAPRVQWAICAAQQKGVTVTIATGRMLEVARPFARALRITAPLICYQGGLIQAPDACAPLYIAPMDGALVSEVLAWATVRGWHAVFYTQCEAFALDGDHPRVFQELLTRERVVWVDDLEAALSNVQPVKLIFIDEPCVVDAIEVRMRERFEGSMAIVRSHRSVVEGGPLGVSKGDGLRRLAKHLSVEQEQTMAIGDRDNDIPMITWAGIGVAMGDGSPGARAAADWVAPTLADDGTAVAIERFVLGSGTY
jgi:Cof subfamily protein (haloacid dehalogenase superfamily)